MRFVLLPTLCLAVALAFAVPADASGDRPAATGAPSMAAPSPFAPVGTSNVRLIAGARTNAQSSVALLGENFPNPFSHETTVPFSVSERTTVRLTVYDALGRIVRVLVDGSLEPGQYETSWNGTTAGGQSLTSGLYLYRLEAGTYTRTRRMLLVR
ncbi:hypothetical protein BH23BAC4_BH23BAC4_15190 [soil metagenome]